MERKTHRRHSAEFKAKVTLEALKEQKTMLQISQQFGLHQIPLAWHVLQTQVLV